MFAPGAAASAAVAHESRMLPHILSDLHQVITIGRLQDIFRFLPGDQPGIASVGSKGPGYVVESQTRLHGSLQLAFLSQMMVLVTAVAKPHAYILCLLNDVRGPLVVQDVIGLLR